MPVAEPAGRELRDYLSVLRRRKGTILLATLVAVVLAIIASILQDRVYEARARVLLKARQSAFDATRYLVRLDSATVETEMEVIQSQPVKEAARERLGLIPAVSVSPVGTTSIVDIKVRGTSPQRAAELANEYVKVYIDYRRTQATDELQASAKEFQSRVDQLQVRIDSLAAELGGLTCTSQGSDACTRRDALQKDRDALLSQQLPFKQKLDQFQVDTSLTDPGATLIAAAVAPTSPVQPRPVRNALMALVVGLVFGVALALTFDHFDDSIKSKEDLERLTPDLPVLGLIPVVAAWKNKSETRLVSQAEPSSPTAEAYRALRTSIQVSNIDSSMRVLMVTSPSAAEGKTTTVANLAVVLARAGQRVVIVGCDLRRPRIHEFFGLSNATGFTSVLLGELPLSRAVQPVPGEDRLYMLGSGRLPPNPSELLSSDRSVQVLDTLRAQYDTVLLDCSPVIPVTDAAVLSSQVDGALVVATAGTTTGKELARAVEVLRQVGAPMLGTVLNGLPADGAYGYQYYYYRRTDEPADQRRGNKKPKQPATQDAKTSI